MTTKFAIFGAGATGGEPEHRVRPRCLADGREAGPQDYVILTVKAHSLTPALDAITPLLGPETAVVTAQNGIPWWYFYKLSGPWQDHRLESVAPGGRVWQAIGPPRALRRGVAP